MPERKDMATYLETVAEQIRWKRARPILVRELEQHLMDQRDVFLEEGHPAEEAEFLAVEEMGDPVAVGTELDSLHRPRPQWGPLALTVLLALAGSVLRVWLTADFAHEEISPLRTSAALLLGVLCLAGGYLGDYTLLGRHAKKVYAGGLLLGLLSLRLSPNVNNASYYTRYVVLLYPVIYAVWLYDCRGKGWKGLFLAIAGGFPLTVVAILAPCLQGMFLLWAVGLILVVLAAGMGWFGLGKGCAAVPLGLAGAMVWGLLRAGFYQQRIALALHPELAPLQGGYQAMTVRAALAGSRLWGTGSLGTRYEGRVYQEVVPEAARDFLPTTLIFKLGWVPFLLLVLVSALLMLWLLRRCLRQRSQLGRLVSLAVVLTLGLQLAMSVAMSLGFLLFSAHFPLFNGNLHMVLDMGLIGLALSVFQSSSIARDQAVPGGEARRCAAE